eukprot:360963-Chlamydomonas_euryale.AAC.1
MADSWPVARPHSSRKRCMPATATSMSTACSECFSGGHSASTAWSCATKRLQYSSAVTCTHAQLYIGDVLGGNEL